jgi:hypothetical protein
MIVEEVLADRVNDAVESRPDDDGGSILSPDARAAERLLARRGSALSRVEDPRVRRQRAYALLARNGFDADVCREASARFVAGYPDETEGAK